MAKRRWAWHKTAALASIVLIAATACSSGGNASGSSNAATQSNNSAATQQTSTGPSQPPASQGVGSQAPTGKLETVTIGLTSFNSLHIEFLVGLAEHLWEPYGIKIELPTLQNVQLGLPGLVSGSLQFTPATNAGLFLAQPKAPELQAVAVETLGMPYVAIAGPKIKSVQDLKGKTFGVDAAGASLDYLALAGILADAGINPLTDVHWVSAGPPAARVAALTSGKVDAVGSFLPDSLKLLGQNGYHVVGKSSTFDGFHAQFDFIVANKNWVAKHHDTAVNFMRGYLKSVTWLMDPANKDKAVKDIAASMKVDTDAATQTYDTFVTQLKMWPAQSSDATLDPASMLKAANYFTKAGLKGLPTSESELNGRYDNSLIEDAIKAGI